MWLIWNQKAKQNLYSPTRITRVTLSQPTDTHFSWPRLKSPSSLVVLVSWPEPSQCQALPSRSSLHCKHNKSASCVSSSYIATVKKKWKVPMFLFYLLPNVHTHTQPYTHTHTFLHNVELTMIVNLDEVVFGLPHSEACCHSLALNAPRLEDAVPSLGHHKTSADCLQNSFPTLTCDIMSVKLWSFLPI